MQFAFGTGVFWGTPLQDANGAAIAVPTPVQLGVMQDISLDISFDTKELYGQSQFPVAVGRGKGKMSIKAKTAQINGSALNSLFFGQTTSSGLASAYPDLVGSTIPTTPFTVTVTPPGAGTWSNDLGVRDSNGVPMTRVASAPTTGQYSVATGVYTFATADTGKTVFISYGYNSATAGAVKGTVKNLLMGQAPSFRGDLFIPYAGKSLIFTIPNCVSSKLGFATKQDDFAVPELELSGFADSAGNVLYWSASDN